MSGCEKYRALIDDWIEGAATSAGEARLRAHMHTCVACRDEFHALDLLRTDLEAIGDAIGDREPLPGIAPAVMAAISKTRAARVRAVEPRSFLRRLAPWLTMTAAAAVVLLFISSGYRFTGNGQSTVARTDAQAPGAKAVPGDSVNVTRENTAAATPEQVEQVKNLALDSLILKGDPQSPQEDVEAVFGLSFEDVLAARRDALTDPEARAALAQWASLTIERARRLINGGADTPGELGAVLMLPPQEAQPLLSATLRENDDPYLKYRLASFYSKNPETIAKAATQYAELAAADSGNALSKYQYAATCFAQGDAAGGLSALADAREMDGVNAYTSAAAKYREQALLAAGAAPDVARALSVFMAGNEEYGQLVDLGNQLLDYGRHYEQNGDMDAAEQIYEAVRAFGIQIGHSASYASEQLAGLDVERAAVEVLSGLASFVGIPENLQMLAHETERLLNSFAAVGQFITSVNDFFSQNQDNALMHLAIDFLFQNGDLGLFDYLHTQSGR